VTIKPPTGKTLKGAHPTPKRVQESGIVEWREEKLEAIHKSILLMLDHVHRLVTQKEELCTLYLNKKAEAQSLRLELDNLAQHANNLHAQVYRMLHGHPGETVQAWEALRDAVPREV
jgi:hypothetical protein